MNTRTKKLAVLLGVGVVLSSGAYALGTQAGGGGALASGSNAAASGAAPAKGTVVVSGRGGPGRPGFRGGPGLDDLATKLGVSETALRDALQAVRDAKTPAQRRAELTQALATALGKPVDQVTSALSSVLPDKPDRRTVRSDLTSDLAKALGVDAAKVKAGLDKARQDFRDGNGNRDRRRFGAGFDTVVNDIASATGVDAAKVRSALQDLRPPRPADRPERRDARDDIRQKLATALGVTTDQLDAAIDKVRTQARDQFATELAQKLNIDPQKVKDALPDRVGFGFGGRRHG